MRISQQLLDEIVARARADAPNECCGMIASRDGEAVAVHRAVNQAERPRVTYEIRGQDLFRLFNEIEGAGLDIGAIYHSHPFTEPKPSPTDIKLALYPDSLYVIVGLEHDEPEVRAWRIVDRVVSEAALEVQDGSPVDTR